MGFEELSRIRLVLERARILLRGQDDLSARALLGWIGELVATIAVTEATRGDCAKITSLQSQAVAMVERVKMYAAKERLHFAVDLTPTAGPLRHDTTRAVDLSLVRDAIAAMPPGSMAPPPIVQQVLEEEQRVVDASFHDTIPAPAPTTSEIQVEE